MWEHNRACMCHVPKVSINSWEAKYYKTDAPIVDEETAEISPVELTIPGGVIGAIIRLLPF